MMTRFTSMIPPQPMSTPQVAPMPQPQMTMPQGMPVNTNLATPAQDQVMFSGFFGGLSEQERNAKISEGLTQLDKMFSQNLEQLSQTAQEPTGYPPQYQVDTVFKTDAGEWLFSERRFERSGQNFVQYLLASNPDMQAGPLLSLGFSEDKKQSSILYMEKGNPKRFSTDKPQADTLDKAQQFMEQLSQQFGFNHPQYNPQ